MKKLNDIAKWAIVAIAIGAIVFNTIVTYNEVRHNTRAIQKLELKIERLYDYLLEQK